ncbi:hypothetical protein DFH07DRAFT_959850 [Mycena maculata]|uniref:Uncharacterized protein n=1 Tax=Mycena maculata TaxID=230809 RepID=A0AAD7J0S6_9AGAR|nr:hypothetical protein DFH07DRAFT_959850 [Mycena maculata]
MKGRNAAPVLWVRFQEICSLTRPQRSAMSGTITTLWQQLLQWNRCLAHLQSQTLHGGDSALRLACAAERHAARPSSLAQFSSSQIPGITPLPFAFGQQAQALSLGESVTCIRMSILLRTLPSRLVYPSMEPAALVPRVLRRG